MSRYVSHNMARRLPAAVGSASLVCALLATPAAFADEATSQAQVATEIADTATEDGSPSTESDPASAEPVVVDGSQPDPTPDIEASPQINPPTEGAVQTEPEPEIGSTDIDFETSPTQPAVESGKEDVSSETDGDASDAEAINENEQTGTAETDQEETPGANEPSDIDGPTTDEASGATGEASKGESDIPEESVPETGAEQTESPSESTATDGDGIGNANAVEIADESPTEETSEPAAPQEAEGEADSTTEKTDPEIGPLAANPSLSFDAADGTLSVSASGVATPTGVVGVSAGITAPDGTCRWYALSKGADGFWGLSINPSDFKWQSGTYRLEISINDASWVGHNAGTTSYTLDFGSEKTSCSLSEDGSTVVATASGGRVAGAWQVSFQVVGSKGTFWALGTEQADGSYRLEFPASQAGPGTVRVTPVAALGASEAWLPSASAEVAAAKATTTLSYDQSTGRFAISATGVSCPSGVVGVSVGIVSPSGTTRWYALSETSDGLWVASVDPADFDWQAGTYAVITSITDSSWNGVDMGTKSTRVSYGSESVSATVDTSENNQVTLRASGGRTVGAWQLTFEIQGSTGTTWVAGVRQDDGSWAVTVPATQSGGGNLSVTALAYVGDSVLNVGQTSVRTYSQTVELTCTTMPSSDSVLLEVGGGKIARAWNVSFAVYNVEDGTSGTTWYQATKQGDGSWSASIPASVNGVGTCIVTAWCNVDVEAEQAAAGRYTYSVVPMYTTSVDLGGGNYDVSYGMSGLKVKAIQEALGIGDPNYPRYLAETQSAVRNFQQRVGLPVTGVVDYDTWIALGLSDYNWTHLGAYASPVQVSANASASQRVEAMISRAQDYLGDAYVWDAAGAPGEGVDCAGLVIQSLYAAGVNTGIINPVTHATTSWGDHDASNLYYYGGFSKVSLADRVRGDLIYYSYGGAGIDHVAIYLGNDSIIEAYPDTVRISNLWNATIIGINRVFS